VDAEALEKNALAFAKSYIPSYVAPLADYEQFDGLPFAGGNLAQTSFSFLKSSTSLGDCALLGDHLLSTLFVAPPDRDASRELVCISPLEEPPTDGPSFRVIGEEEDYASKLLKRFPVASGTLKSELDRSRADNETLSAEAEELKGRVAELSGLQSRIDAFEADPLSAILDAVRNLDRKIDSLPSRMEVSRPPTATVHFAGPRRSPVSPGNSREPEPVYEYNWFVIGLLAILVIFLVTLAYLAIKAWLPW
jgi:hypothetical protein